MNYSKARILSIAILYVGGAVFLATIIYNFMLSENPGILLPPYMAGVVMGILIAAMVVRFIFYKCPHCRTNLPARGPKLKTCPKCEEDL